MRPCGFPLSPDAAFPPNRSWPPSPETDDHDADSIEEQDVHRVFSIDYCFPPFNSETNSEVHSESATSSPLVFFKETLELDNIYNSDNEKPVLRQIFSARERMVQNKMPLLKRIYTARKRVMQVGLERAVEVLDTLGSSMSNLTPRSGFTSGMASKWYKVSVLAFEVANTIAKGSTLLNSLSGENLKFLKEDILHSKGVRNLVSTSMEELLGIAASDKREELDVFLREVIRFGNLCKDPQWHDLDRYFAKNESDYSHHKQLRDEAEITVHQLVILNQHTSELYHELQALDRFEQQYSQKIWEAEALNIPRKDVEESLMILRTKLKAQRKHVRSLKKKSLWSRHLEEITEKLVDLFACIHQEIVKAFGNDGLGEIERSPERLGKAGLALHYARIIQLIDSIASSPSSLSPNKRKSLYSTLPVSVKTALRSGLLSLNAEEELSVSDIEAEMKKTLEWLVPLATNTTKAHICFGWVGEWANTGKGFSNGETANSNNLMRFQTLYHAEKHKMDFYILELVVWLHRLVISVRKRDQRMKYLPLQSPTGTGYNILISKTQLSPSPDYGLYNAKTRNTVLSPEDRFLLEKLLRRNSDPGTNRSRDFFALNRKKGRKIWALSRSIGNSPERDLSGENISEQQSTDILDLLDGLNFRF